MEQRKKIELTIPTIDLSLLKKLKGGYYLPPAYCIDTYDPHWYADTDDGRDDEQVHEDDNMDSQYEYEHEVDDRDDQIGQNGFVFSGFSIEQTQSILNRISSLPAAYQNLNVQFLASTSLTVQGEYLNGKITLKVEANGNLNTGSVLEEMTHALQAIKYGGDANLNEIPHSVVEYEAKMVCYLVEMLTGGSPLLVDGMSDMAENLYDDKGLNVNYFLEHAADYYDEWFNVNIINAEEGYTDKYVPDYDYDWGYWLNLFGLTPQK